MGPGIRSNSESTFWILVHLVDPECPTEHPIFNVPAGIYHNWIFKIEPLVCLLMNDHCFLFLPFEMSFVISLSSVRSFSIPGLFSKENALKVLHVVSLFFSLFLICFFSGFSSFCLPLSSLAISFVVCGARQHHLESSITAGLVTETHFMNG